MGSYSGELTGAVGLVSNTGGLRGKDQVEGAVDGYEKYHSLHGGDVAARKASYADMVNRYYDLATSFYEYGWGESFHFAHRVRNETLRDSIRRHEHFLALKLGLKPGDKVLDVGCGIGGPLREIAIFSGASITGLNNNAYQITRGEALNHYFGLDKTCNFLKADFMKIPQPDNTYDAVYEIEATCHAPEPVNCYRELLRVLKPGGCFAGYEWCMTASFDADNAEHRRIKSEIEIGNGLPDLQTVAQCRRALVEAGFEVLDAADLTLTAEVPWWQPLGPALWELRTPQDFARHWMGRFLTRNAVKLLEKVRIAPGGSVRVQEFLEKGADGLLEGGRKELFTPMYFFVARKPLQSKLR
ncbi:sterol 24-C-methyltransferase [Klebsormidium nitens]|uniref:Methyltransferase n=1 Tax=Klebsormidium nitens TaxID=105231 RepID=A0A1Y1IA73_KLENI|nr:sterol 24-C-methyltransferase [Klebsormidium nitens]|eukprot:GAQ86329.1 sterol 24-C-methyltransferase [Klebsormidium nitens]